MNITIRKFLPHDKQHVEHCIVELQNYEVLLEPNRVSGEQMAEKYLQHLLKECGENQGKLLVAEKDTTIVGFICFWKDTFGEEYVRVNNDRLYVSDFMVLEGYRNQGVGKTLMHHAEAYAKERGLKTVAIGVLANNILARDVYKKLGFQEYDMTLTKIVD